MTILLRGCRPGLLSAADEETAPERRAGLSLREFAREYRDRRVPVILTDAIDAWPAREWTPERLRDRVGSHEVRVRTQQGPLDIPFDVLTDLILASTVDHPAPYGRNIDIRHDLPGLWPDIQPRLKYAAPDWKSSRLLPRDFVFPDGLVELFYGGCGASFPRLHVDYWGMDGFIAQIHGEKEFLLFGPDQTPCLYPDPADGGLTSQVNDPDQPDLDRFPRFAQARGMRFRLRPGETLYLPNGWWHTTWMPETSITVITAAWHRANWPAFLRQYRLRGRTRRLTKLAALSYLTAAGLLLSVRDRIVHGV